MFESKLAGVLNQVLGSYVHGISTDDLKVAVFKGDVVLTNMRLKVEALNALGPPRAQRRGGQTDPACLGARSGSRR